MAVTVTYEYPVAGVVAPTAQQALEANSLVAIITATADADVLATVTHNWALSATELAEGWPNVIIEEMLPEGWVSTPHVLEASKTTNAVAVTMSNAVGSGAATPQFRVTLQRPHSIMK